MLTDAQIKQVHAAISIGKGYSSTIEDILLVDEMVTQVKLTAGKTTIDDVTEVVFRVKQKAAEFLRKHGT